MYASVEREGWGGVVYREYNVEMDESHYVFSSLSYGQLKGGTNAPTRRGNILNRRESHPENLYVSVTIARFLLHLQMFSYVTLSQ